MSFNSYFFILFFLPITLAGYYTINRLSLRAGSVFLLGMSLWFYGYFNPIYLLIIISSVLVNYALSHLIYRFSTRKTIAKALLVFGLLANIGCIFYFKYYDFFIENINTIFRQNWMTKNLLLPLGISFFTFQQISFLVDSYKGETSDYSFLDYALFVTFFPQLVAGPIVLHSELIPQFADKSKRVLNMDNMCTGLQKFVFGLSKKVLLADVLGSAVDWAFSNISYTSGADMLLAMLAYTLQIYFDFSGYSDMACGLGQMFNITLPINFDSPYKSDNIADFWKGWHITLTRFLRTYIYFPLGGSRKGLRRKYLNLLIVFLVSGIWHGANYTFILWGLAHGVLRVSYEIFKKPYEKMHHAFKWFINFAVINLTWLMFRVIYWKDFFSIIKRILRAENMSLSPDMINQFNRPLTDCFLSFGPLSGLWEKIPGLVIIGYVFVAMFIVLNCTNNYRRSYRNTWQSMILTGGLLAICILSLGNVSTFLYFNF